MVFNRRRRPLNGYYLCALLFYKFALFFYHVLRKSRLSRLTSDLLHSLSKSKDQNQKRLDKPIMPRHYVMAVIGGAVFFFKICSHFFVIFEVKLL